MRLMHLTTAIILAAMLVAGVPLQAQDAGISGQGGRLCLNSQTHDSGDYRPCRPKTGPLLRHPPTRRPRHAGGLELLLERRQIDLNQLIEASTNRGEVFSRDPEALELVRDRAGGGQAANGAGSTTAAVFTISYVRPGPMR